MIGSQTKYGAGKDLNVPMGKSDAQFGVKIEAWVRTGEQRLRRYVFDPLWFVYFYVK